MATMAASEGFDCDYVVIGSGFGGSVAALRLSQKGYRVRLIEAGRRWGRESFPRSSWDTRNYLWAPALGCTGPQQMRLLRHALVLSGVGVGGGSLIYGNTLFEPLDRFFAEPVIESLGGARVLRPYYELARKMMGVVANPRITPMDEHARAVALEYGRGDTFTPSPVGVFFGEPGQEAADPYFEGQGPDRVGCTSCGGCFLGCRVGAKNTLDLNYLHLAERLGCVIVPETRVGRVVPLGDDGSGGYVLHTRGSVGRARRRREQVRCRGVVVAGGVMGTLGLLMDARARGDLSAISQQLGQRVRTNSETVVAVRCRDGSADHSKGIAASTSVFPDEHTQIQIDRYPGGSDSMAALSALMVDGGRWWPRWLGFVGAALRRPLDFLRTLWPGGFARQTAILVVMQDLDNKLSVVRRRRWLPPFGHRLQSECDPADAAPSYIPIGNDFARRLAKRINAIALSSTPEVFLDVPATAHILGGCPIGSNRNDGVVDAQHRVFGYQNLYVCDGSIVPVNLGVNPALTILALSERAMAQIPVKPGATMQNLNVDRTWGVGDLLVPPLSP